MSAAPKHRESLIAASAALFQRQGYAGTGLAEILAASGAPKGSLYHYFPDGKEAIGEAAIRAAGGLVEQRMRAAADSVRDPRKVALGYGRAMAETLESSGFAGGCPIASVALECAPASPRLNEAVRDVFASWSAVIAGMLRNYGVAGPRAAELADMLIASVQGAMILARVRRSTVPVVSAAAGMARLFDAEISAGGVAQ